MRSIRRFVISVVLSAPLALVAPAHGQTGAASITGLLIDQTGAALAGATVVATNQATSVEYTTRSNDVGAYTIASVPVGSYVVRAERAGFKTVATWPVPVEASQIARLDLVLGIGALDETIEVIARNPLMQTETASVGEVVSGTTATGLPLNGRNTSQLTLLLPGTVTPNPASFTAIRNFGGGRPFVNGHREQTNNYLLDGVDMNESVGNLVPYQPSPDALAEISVETNNYPAELGNVSGAVINNIFKSGTNQLHGNVFEFLRDSRFDANPWAANRSSASKQERTQHIFGGTIGGPLVRNRMFFFGDYQGTRLDEPGDGIASVAPEEWRRGDFSGLAGVTIIDPLTGRPFPGNVLPANRINPVARAILSDTSLYPLPNRSVGGVQGNYVDRRLTGTRADQWDVKIDANLSTRDNVFARYSHAAYESFVERETIPLFLGPHEAAPTRNFGLNWFRVIGPSVVNEMLVGYNQVGVARSFDDLAGLGNMNEKLGIPGGQPIPGLSWINFGSGLSGIGTLASTLNALNKTYQINERFTWNPGLHTVKFGGQLLHLSQRRDYAGNNGALGLFSYTGAFTNFGFADFLLDQVSQKGRGSVAPPWTQIHDRIAVYIQDDFKVSQNLTLNLGLRWAYTSPLVEKDDRQSNFDLTTGRQLLAGKDGSSRALYEPYYKGVEPRLGVALTLADFWVVRGAYGIVQHMEGTGANLRLPMNPPFFFESDVQYDRTTGPGTIRTGFEGLQPLDSAAGQVRAWDPKLQPQFTHQWNVFVERLLGDTTSASVGYVGHHAEHLVTPVEGNQPLPGTGPASTWLPLQERRPLYAFAPQITNISTTAAQGRSDYRALQTSVRQQLTNGLEFLGSYTWSQAMTNNLGYYGAPGLVAASGFYWQNAHDPDSEYGPAFFDATHNFVWSGSYELPGGLSLSGIVQWRSGFPVTVIDSRGSSLQAVRGLERPNRIGSGKVPHPTIDRWIDIDAFSRAELGTWGNSGVGILRAPDYANVDLAVTKRLWRGALVRVEAFNVLNRANFGPPAHDLNAPNTFGTITNTVGSPRTMELVAKFNF